MNVLFQDAKAAFKPTRYWGPALPRHRRLMRKFMNRDDIEVDPWKADAEAEAQVAFDEHHAGLMSQASAEHFGVADQSPESAPSVKPHVSISLQNPDSHGSRPSSPDGQFNDLPAVGRGRATYHPPVGRGRAQPSPGRDNNNTQL